MPAPPVSSAPLVKYLGSGFLSALTDAKDHPACVIGKDRFTKVDLAGMGIVQTGAAGRLSRVCKSLAVTSVADLYKKTHPYTFADTIAGEATIFVMFRIFEAHDLNVEKWYRLGKDEAVVQFVTLKHKHHAAEARTKAAEKRRERSKRAKAHEAAVAELLNGGGR